MADYRAILEARRERRKQRRDPRKPDAAAQSEPTLGESAAVAQPRGGFGISPGGRGISAPRPGVDSQDSKGGDSSNLESWLKTGAKVGSKALQEFSRPAPSPSFDRGSSEPAFQEQRAGERQDFTGGAFPQVSAPGSFPNVQMPTMDINTPYSADMTFSMPDSSGGATATAGGMSGGVDANAVGSAVGGLLAMGLSGKQLADAINSGSTAGTISGGIGLTTGALVTAAQMGNAAAQTALAAAGPWLGVAAPVIVGVLGHLQQQEAQQAERFNALQMRDKLGWQQEQTGTANAQLSTVDPNDINPDKQQAYLDALGRMFQSSDFSGGLETGGIKVNESALENAGALAGAGPNPSATGDNQAQMNQLGKDILAGVPGSYQRMAYMLSKNPELVTPSWEVGGGKTRDVMEAQAGHDPYSSWYEHLPNTPAPYTEQREMFNDPFIAPNPELGDKYPRELLSSPYFAQQYWQERGVTPQQAFLYGAGQNANLAGANMQLPGIEGGFGGYDPTTLYGSLVAGGMPSLDPVQAPVEAASSGAMPGATPGAGAMDPGTAAGGAGKRAPQFITPEIDNRTEARGGKLGGQQGSVNDPGVPFGMAGKRGGMGVGGAPKRQEGGRPGGQAPFGGVAKQTMMPAQSGGVQARKQGQRGVV